MVVGDGSPAGSRLLKALAERGSLELLLLQTAVPDEGSYNDSVRDGCSCKNLEGGEQGAVLLRSSMRDDRRYPVTGDGHQYQRKGEQKGQRDLATSRHGRQMDDGDGEHDQEQVSDNVACPHGDELRIALTTLRPWIRGDLPVVVKGLALRQGRDEHGDEGCRKEEADDLEDILERTSPYLRRDPSKELGYGKLGRPYTVRVLVCR